MNSKEYFFNEVIKESLSQNSESLRVLELGCGTAGYVPAMIEEYPSLEYFGVEPIDESYSAAVKNLTDIPRSKIVNQLGYDEIEGLEESAYDVVISFSVLEHVKQLERFIKMGTKYLKPGGLMVHRYDLGHALYPGHFKERLHVFLGNNFPAILPERQFVRYVPLAEVENLFEKHTGHKPYRRTHHQMPGHKRLEKDLREAGLSTEALLEVYPWEFKHSENIDHIPVSRREKLFPTVAVWGRKA